jgi:hypothetical protein
MPSLFTSIAESELQYYWLRPGVYVKYELSKEPLKELPGFPSFYREDGTNRVTFANETILKFSNMVLSWKIIDIDEDRVLVEYVFELIDILKYQGYQNLVGKIDKIRYSIRLSVDPITLNVYNEEDEYIGRWPFWTNLNELNKEIIMVHGQYKYQGDEPKREDIIVSLKDLIEFIERTRMYENIDINTLDFETPMGIFKFTRLMAYQPTFMKIEINKANVTVNTNSNISNIGRPTLISRGMFFGLYDKVSLIMIAYSGGYIDDILLYIFKDTPIIFNIRISTGLVITDSNIDFEPTDRDTKFLSEYFPHIILGVIIAITIVLVTIHVQRKGK